MNRTYSEKNEALGRDLAEAYDQTGGFLHEKDNLAVKVLDVDETRGVDVQVTFYGKDYMIRCSDYTKNIDGCWQDSNQAAQIMRATIDALRELGY